MKTIKFVGYLFYRYYSKGSRDNIPYFSTICSMTLIGFMHFMQVLILLNKVELIPIKSSDHNLVKRIIIFFVMLPIYFLMTQLFRKKDIEPLKENYDYNWDKVFKGNVWLVTYIIRSFALIFVLVSW